MEAIESLLTVIVIGLRDWIASNQDALIVEAISIALTVGCIETVLRWRERRKWAPTKRQVALDVGHRLEGVLAEIMEVSGLTWSDVLQREAWPEESSFPTKDFFGIEARFFEQQYRDDFATKYHNALRQQPRHEWVTFLSVVKRHLTELDKSMPLVANLFAPQVATLLLEVKERARWAGGVLYHSFEEDPADRNLVCIELLASTTSKALRMICDEV